MARRNNGSRVKLHFTKWGIIALAVVLALGSVGVTYACWHGHWGWPTHARTVCTYYFNNPFTWVVSNDDGNTTSRPPYGVIDPGDNGNDPSEPQSLGTACARYDKDVATTTAHLKCQCKPHHIIVTVSNGYPCYYPTVFFGIKNCAHIKSTIINILVDENYTGPCDTTDDDIDALDVSYGGIYIGQTINPCAEIAGNLQIHVEQPAKQNWTYNIRVRIKLKAECTWDGGGTPGYWRNWKKHYQKYQVDGWLNDIDAGSGWLVADMAWPYGTINTRDMNAIFNAGAGGWATPRNRFLRHYLATRLNVEAEPPLLYLESAHDITGISGYEYLGLSDPSSATLSEIITAIESKYGTSPTSNQYNTIKNICDALNNSNI